MKEQILSITDGASGEHMTIARVFLMVLGTQPSGGISIADMRKTIQIMDVLESVNDGEEIELSREQWQHVATAYRAVSFTFMHRDLITIDDLLEEATNGNS